MLWTIWDVKRSPPKIVGLADLQTSNFWKEHHGFDPQDWVCMVKWSMAFSFRGFTVWLSPTIWSHQWFFAWLRTLGICLLCYRGSGPMIDIKPKQPQGSAQLVGVAANPWKRKNRGNKGKQVNYCTLTFFLEIFKTHKKSCWRIWVARLDCSLGDQTEQLPVPQTLRHRLLRSSGLRKDLPRQVAALEAHEQRRDAQHWQQRQLGHRLGALRRLAADRWHGPTGGRSYKEALVEWKSKRENYEATVKKLMFWVPWCVWV